MDDEEDDVFVPDSSHCWRTAFREIKYEDRGTQTPSPALALPNDMLPCGVAQEPRPLFYGNAGFRLHFPARFEQVGDQGPQERHQGERGRMERLQQQPQQPAQSMEVCIGQKLQLIGDQFHQEHLQLYHRNQRNMRPLWWRLASALLTLLFEQEAIAGRGGDREDQPRPPLSHRDWTPNGTVKFNTGLLGEKKKREKVTAGRRQPFLYKVDFFQEDAMLFHEIPLLDDVLILVIV